MTKLERVDLEETVNRLLKSFINYRKVETPTDINKLEAIKFFKKGIIITNFDKINSISADIPIEKKKNIASIRLFYKKKNIMTPTYLRHELSTPSI